MFVCRLQTVCLKELEAKGQRGTEAETLWLLWMIVPCRRSEVVDVINDDVTGQVCVSHWCLSSSAGANEALT